ncbi:MAG: tyrosine-protein phosphatase [Atopobiaceae bacterium]|nr:tyrosine-protein phosphatase [Atopobiaceae bacterium]
MGIVNDIMRWFSGGDGSSSGPIIEGRHLDVSSGDNYRDLGGYDTPWGPTAYRRFVRAGSTSSLTRRDLERLEAYGVCRVLDLRSPFEDPAESCRFSRRPKIAWLNVPLFDYDLSDPKLSGTEIPDGNYLIDGYVTMLSNHEMIRRAFEFFAATPKGGTVLFHCAAGMDRTGMTAMLLLGLAEVPYRQIVADYLYSFASVEEVDRVVFDGEDPRVTPASWNPIPSRKQAIEFMLDRVGEGYGSTRAYLAACGISDASLDVVRGMLIGSYA